MRNSRVEENGQSEKIHTSQVEALGANPDNGSMARIKIGRVGETPAKLSKDVGKEKTPTKTKVGPSVGSKAQTVRRDAKKQKR